MRSKGLVLPNFLYFSNPLNQLCSGAQSNIIPCEDFLKLDIPLFDVENPMSGACGESYDIIGGAFLTVEHPNNPAGFKTSSGLFVVSTKAKYCLLSLATLMDLGCVEETFPAIAPLQVKFISLLLLHLQFRWMVGTEELQPRLHIYSLQALKYKVKQSECLYLHIVNSPYKQMNDECANKCCTEQVCGRPNAIRYLTCD